MNIDSSIVYSVSQLNNLAKSYLERQCSDILVKGEISSLKKYPSGYVYITIKDISSEINCVIFPDIPNISELEVGYEFNFRGNLSIYAPKGRYQFVIKSFKKNEIGGLWEEYIILKQKLEKEGLFNKEKKKEIPKYPFNVGIISSLEGAVIHDMENVIKRRSDHIKMHISPSRIQGKDAVLDILDSINLFNKQNIVDLIIIARGGGSFEDLNCFNSEKMARGISSSNIPIITAIGHETDFTIADFVSDLRAATPSVAAEIITQSTIDILYSIKDLSNRMYNALSNKIDNYSYQHQSMKNNLKFDNLLIMTDKILDNKRHLDKILLYTIKNKISSLDKEIGQYKKRIQNNNIRTIIRKGFALISNEKGDVVSSVDNVRVNEKISIQLNRGNIGAKVIEKK